MRDDHMATRAASPHGNGSLSTAVESGAFKYFLKLKIVKISVPRWYPPGRLSHRGDIGSHGGQIGLFVFSPPVVYRGLDNSSSASTWTQEVTWFQRDQGGTSANYVDLILTKIAADNYISKQTGEQSIVLSTEQRWPLPSACISQPRQWRAIQFTPPPRRWHSCRARISHLSTSGPSSLAENQPNSDLFFFFLAAG